MEGMWKECSHECNQKFVCSQEKREKGEKMIGQPHRNSATGGKRGTGLTEGNQNFERTISSVKAGANREFNVGQVQDSGRGRENVL